MYLIAVTGHRPPKIGGYPFMGERRMVVRDAIEAAITAAATKFDSDIGLITGGALGVDQDAAFVASEMFVPYMLAAPCKQQDSKWPNESKMFYRTVCKNTSDIVLAAALEKLAPTTGRVVPQYPGVFVVHDGMYNNTCMQERNVWMVDRADAVLAVWDGSKGGTNNCIQYAKAKGIPIKRINPKEL